MARLTVDLELEQVRAIVSDLDSTLDPVGFARLHGGVSDVYRIDFAGAENPLILKVYGDEPAWIVAKEALVAGWIGERAGIPIPRWLRVDASNLHSVPLCGHDVASRRDGAEPNRRTWHRRRLSANGGTAEASTRHSHDCLRLHRRRRHLAAPADQR